MQHGPKRPEVITNPKKPSQSSFARMTAAGSTQQRLPHVSPSFSHLRRESCRPGNTSLKLRSHYFALTPVSFIKGITGLWAWWPGERISVRSIDFFSWNHRYPPMYPFCQFSSPLLPVYPYTPLLFGFSCDSPQQGEQPWEA